MVNSYKNSALHFTLVPFQDLDCAAIYDPQQRLDFALHFLARVEVDDMWPENILWTDEAHFTLEGAVNTQNCRILGST